MLEGEGGWGGSVSGLQVPQGLPALFIGLVPPRLSPDHLRLLQPGRAFYLVTPTWAFHWVVLYFYVFYKSLCGGSPSLLDGCITIVM